MGEDRGYDPDDEGVHAEDKPIRVLSNFSFFDPKRHMEMVCLSVLEEDDGVERLLEGAGTVTPFFQNEEDEGQEDGLYDPDEHVQPQFVRLSRIRRFTIDPTKQNEWARIA